MYGERSIDISSVANKERRKPFGAYFIHPLSKSNPETRSHERRMCINAA